MGYPAGLYHLHRPPHLATSATRVAASESPRMGEGGRLAVGCNLGQWHQAMRVSCQSEATRTPDETTQPDISILVTYGHHIKCLAMYTFCGAGPIPVCHPRPPPTLPNMILGSIAIGIMLHHRHLPNSIHWSYGDAQGSLMLSRRSPPCAPRARPSVYSALEGVLVLGTAKLEQSSTMIRSGHCPFCARTLPDGNERDADWGQEAADGKGLV